MKLKHAIKCGRYSHPVRSNNVDYMSYSSASTNSHLVRVASYDIEGQMSSNSSWRTDLAQAQSSEEEEPTTRRYSITVHDLTDSESMASTQYSYRKNVVETNGSDLARADKQIQKKGNSLMSSFWSCLNPKLPGEMGIKHTVASKSQVATMRALSSNEDALDRVFNALEGFTCQDDNDLVELRERRIIGTREQPNMAKSEDPPDYIDQNKRKKNTIGTQKLSGKNGIERDILDNAFEKVEMMICQDSGDCSTLVPYESDLLDSVFEGLEGVACRDDYEEERLQGRQASPAARLPEGRATAMSTESDMLDRVFEGFEHTMCHRDGAAIVGSEANMLHDVSERLEYTVYREPAPGRNGVRSHEPIDLTAYSLDLQNSIVDPSLVKNQSGALPQSLLIMSQSGE
jgi:hypothetical protein